jgi:hypothetical protein
MAPILIAEATAECVRVALLRHHCRRLAERQDCPAQVREVAVAPASTLAHLVALRGSRRDVSKLLRRVEGLEARLTEAGYGCVNGVEG